MKKYIILLVVFFSMFIGIKNTKAATTLSVGDYVNWTDYGSYQWKFTYVAVNEIKITQSTFNINRSFSPQEGYPYITISLEKSSNSYAYFIIYSQQPLYLNSNRYLRIQDGTQNTEIKRYYASGGRYSGNVLGSNPDVYNTTTSSNIIDLSTGSTRSIVITNYEADFSNYYINYRSGYSYENYVNCNGISEIQIDFDVPQNESFNFELDFKSQFINIDTPKPYLQYIEKLSGDDDIIIDNFVGDIENLGVIDINGNEIYQYSGIIDNLNWVAIPMQNLKIRIDVSEYGNNDYYLNLKSNYDFNVSLIPKSEEQNYLTTIDLTDKYGIYLIPKTLNQDVYQTINLVGAYDIQIRSNYISDDNYTMSDFFLDYNRSTFQYLFTLNDLNTLLYFMNANYVSGSDSGHYITFDSRYFSYVIKETQFQEPTILNPNTNTEITIKDPTDIDDTDDVKSFVKSVQLYLTKFSELFTYLYNSLPILVKRCLVSLFIILIITSAVLIVRGRR